VTGKKLSFLIILLSISLCGCADNANDEVWMARQPLGQEYQGYEPPKLPSSSSAETELIAEPNDILTLSQAHALALIHNPQLRVFAWEVRASEARQLQASLGPNPEIEVEMEEVAGSGGRDGFDGAETAVVLSQTIELGNKRSKRVEVASLQKDLAGWDYQANRLDVFTQVTKSFVGVLAAQQKSNLAEDLVVLSRKVLKTASQRVEAGKDSPVEQTKAEIVLANAEIEFEKAQKYLEAARIELSITWAGRTPAFDKAEGKLDSISAAPSLDELAGSIQSNPDMARWAVEMDQRSAALKLAKANAVSDVTVGGGVQRFNETDDNAFVFGVSIPLPIFNRNQGEVLEARYAIAKARAQRRAVEASIHTALSSAYATLTSAYAEATGLKDKVLEGAQSAFDAAEEGYRAGKLDFLVVLDAQRTLFEAKGRYIEALTDYHLAKADIERLLGSRIND
jgi:cobalt-zinc-cadmium efflux system outer membrane protein